MKRTWQRMTTFVRMKAFTTWRPPYRSFGIESFIDLILKGCTSVLLYLSPIKIKINVKLGIE